eukprot:COSAG02_NODE_19119_length_899_cov_1.088750_3_plen_50_part_01
MEGLRFGRFLRDRMAVGGSSCVPGARLPRQERVTRVFFGALRNTATQDQR